MVNGFLAYLADQDEAFHGEVPIMRLVDAVADKPNQPVATGRSLSQRLSQTITELCRAG